MESVGTLAGGIAHDLNNGLAPILMAVEVLKNQVTDDACLKVLALVNASVGIVKSHGGFINLYSEMGKGTIFKVYLPANTTSEAIGSTAARKPRLPRGNGELVLLVDDEERLRIIAQTVLEQFGYRVMPAANGAEAVALYAQHGKEVAIVLTDMAMPVMDGSSTVVALRTLNPQVKVIGSSAVASGFGDAAGLGIKHFVSKPYSAETMLDVLAQALREDV